MNILDIKRKPVHPGEVLREEFLKPLSLKQTKLAVDLNVTFRTINELANEKRSVSPLMALKLSEYFKTTPEFWMNLQSKYDLCKTKENMLRTA
ncbi:MAG: HigA family addiction module antitoxin [Deltaproteobacteria bacterium]|jgi:addiction module HigA family antidote|nr:HigA family addiction module antitoxin [Deltaproteobacteria bacterium]